MDPKTKSSLTLRPESQRPDMGVETITPGILYETGPEAMPWLSNTLEIARHVFLKGKDK